MSWSRISEVMYIFVIYVLLMAVSVYGEETDEDVSLSHLGFFNKVSSLFKKDDSNVEHGNLSGIGRDILSDIVDGVEHLFSVEDYMKNVSLIIPGTRWCGAGNNAGDPSQLGFFEEPDKCCREHDDCPIAISRGQSMFGLKNEGLFTRSHCSCDEKFHECLKKADSTVALEIGRTYFNVLGPNCFKEDHPIIGCKRTERVLKKRCVEYLKDTSSPKVWQWFDNPPF